VLARFNALVFRLVARTLFARLRLTPGLRGAANGEQRNAIAQRIDCAAIPAVNRGRPDHQVCGAARADQDVRDGRKAGAIIGRSHR
jgi:hypothetical protein